MMKILVPDNLITIKDLKIILLEYFPDERGMNFEGYNKNNDIPDFPKFKIDSFSISKKGVLRGFHGDNLNYKLVQCLFGAINLVVIDKRKKSKTYDEVYNISLHYGKPIQVLIPPGCVNAHQCLSDHCVFSYKLSHSYVPIQKQMHIKWNDPKYNINWSLPPILSNRDR